MRFNGIDVHRAWCVAFWVILLLAVIASAGHAIIG